MKVGVAFVIAVGCEMMITAPVQAQNRGRVGHPPTAYGTPVLSPYLNLTGAQNSADFGRQFFLRTVPELQLRNAATDLNKSVNQLQGRVQRQERQATNSQIGVSGHKTAFQNLGGYFPGSNRR